ncbi:TPA: pilus assembly protein PilV [Escherichia coli]
MLTLQVHWLAEKPDGKGSRSPFAIFPVRTVLPDTLIHEPDWHGGQCQSGTWKKNGGGTVQMVTATASDWNQPIATATCPSGKKVTGGGGMCSFSNAILKRSSPSGNSAWVAGCSQNTNQNQYYSVTTYALCQ